MKRQKLVVPATLVISMLSVSGCDDDDGGTDTSGSTSGSSSAQECADIVDEAACDAETKFECVWNPDNAECEPNCAAYPDEQSCNQEVLCVWDSSGCLGPI